LTFQREAFTKGSDHANQGQLLSSHGDSSLPDMGHQGIIRLAAFALTWQAQ
jgi:hypothetical protein